MSDKEDVDDSLPDDDYDEANADEEYVEEEEDAPEISYETEDDEPPDVRFPQKFTNGVIYILSTAL